MRWTAGRILGSVFVGAAAVRLTALLFTRDPGLHFEKFFLLARRLIADGWVPRDPFADSPAYIYFLAAALTAGASPLVIACAQILLGSLACVAISEVARRLFGPFEAAVAGSWAALFGPFILYDISFESDSLGLVLYAALSLAVVAAARRPSPARFALAGLLLGLRAIQRPNVLLLAPLLLLAWWLLDRDVRSGRRAVPLLAAFCLAAALPVLPIAWLNLRASGEPVPVMSSAGWVFYTSHNHAATGLSYYPPPLALAMMQAPASGEDDPLDRLDGAVSRHIASLASDRPLSAGEASRFWLREGLRSIRERGLGQFGIQVKKIYYMLHGYEGHDNLALLVKQERLGPLTLLGMGVLSPFALLGLFFVFQSRDSRTRDVWLLAPFLLAPILSMSLFYVGPRFRLELAAILIPFAALAVSRLRDLARSGATRQAAMAAGSLLVLVYALHADWGDVRRQERSRLIQLRTFQGARAPDAREAAARYTSAIDAAFYPAEAEAAHRGLASLARESGNPEEAARLEAIARGLLPGPALRRLASRPRDPEALWAVGRHFFILKDLERARAAFGEASRLAPNDPDPLFARALAGFEGKADPPEEIARWINASLRLGLRFSPDAVTAYILLGRCYLEMERWQEAGTSLALALRRDPANERALALLARVRAGASPDASVSVDSGTGRP